MSNQSLREKLKQNLYGRSLCQLVSGEKAIFDRLPPNADEETLKITERLLKIFTRVFWTEEDLSQDDEDFKFAKEFCENYRRVLKRNVNHWY